MNSVSQGSLNKLVLSSLLVSINHKSLFYFVAEFVR